MDKFARIRELFPVTREKVYLNNAAVSPVPPFIGREAALIYEGYALAGGDREGEWLKRVEEVRGRVAQLVGADSREICFVKNTTEGMVLAARGIRWREGDSVVSLRGEFPAVTVPLNLLAGLGVELRLVSPEPDNSFDVQRVAEAMDGSTRMVMVSFIEFHTGARNDLAALGEVCREREVFFAVDGVQGVGALQTAVRDWKVDLLSAGGHKWLLAGEGVGFCYVRRECLDRLEPVTAGWLSVEDPVEFLRLDLEEAPFDKPLRADARRYEGGTLNIAGIHCLGRSVETMLELGVNDIETRILMLGARLVEGLRAKGYRVLSPQGRGHRSGITCFRPERGDARKLLVDLRRRGFSLGFPCGSLRASPHYYNNEEDIDRLLEALP